MMLGFMRLTVAGGTSVQYTYQKPAKLTRSPDGWLCVLELLGHTRLKRNMLPVKCSLPRRSQGSAGDDPNSAWMCVCLNQSAL